MQIFDGATCLWPLGAELGEGPVWRPSEGAVWFVDIKRHCIHRFTVSTGERQSWTSPDQVGFVLPTQYGGWIAGLRSGPHCFDPSTGRFIPLLPIEGHLPEHRLNDGWVDRWGRLWFGSMNDDGKTRGGKLYRLCSDGVSRAQDRGYIIPNGPCTSPDGSTFYHTDTGDQVIYAFDLAADGTLGKRRIFALLHQEGAYPDGTCVDSEGCLWTALFGGGGLRRYSPSGEWIGFAPLPVSNVTKAAFGGPDLRTLFITTAATGLTEAERSAQPLAGGLFAIEAPAPGIAPSTIAEGITLAISKATTR